MSNIYQQYQHDINKTTGQSSRKALEFLGIAVYEGIKSIVGAIKFMISMFMGKY